MLLNSNLKISSNFRKDKVLFIFITVWECILGNDCIKLAWDEHNFNNG